MITIFLYVLYFNHYQSINSSSFLENKLDTLPGKGEIRSALGLSGEGFGLSDDLGGSLGSLFDSAESKLACECSNS